MQKNYWSAYRMLQQPTYPFKINRIILSIGKLRIVVYVFQNTRTPPYEVVEC